MIYSSVRRYGRRLYIFRLLGSNLVYSILVRHGHWFDGRTRGYVTFNSSFVRFEFRGDSILVVAI